MLSYDNWINNSNISFYSNIGIGIHYSLNLKKKLFTSIENYIIDIIKLKINNYENYNIEFWVDNKKDISISYNRDSNNLYLFPVYSFVNYICIIENISPFIIANINMENYNYKNFKNENEIALSYPKSNKIVCFQGNLFNGFTHNENITNENPLFLFINIWENYPINCITYNNNYNYEIDIGNKKSIYMENDDKINIFINNLILNEFFYEKILYKKEYSLFFELQKQIDDEITNQTKTNIIVQSKIFALQKLSC